MTYLTDNYKGRLAACSSRYREVAAIVHVPWWFLASIHYLESDLAESAGENTAYQLVDVMQSSHRDMLIQGFAVRAGLPSLPDPRSNLKSAMIIAGFFIQDKVGGTLTENSTQEQCDNAAFRYNGAGYRNASGQVDITLSPYVYSDPQNGHALTVHERGPNGPINVVFQKAGTHIIGPEIRGEDAAPTVAPPTGGVVYYPIENWGGVRVDHDKGSFLAPGYSTMRIGMGLPPAEHTGSDFNTGGAGDADLGTPIYAVTAGVVKGSAYFPEVWGNIIVIDHPQFAVASMYAHLQNRYVQQGDIIEAGQQIGTMGNGAPIPPGATVQTANGHYFTSHLHFEIRRNRNLRTDNWPGGEKAAVRALIQKEYVDSELWFQAVHAKDLAKAPDPLIDSLVKVKDQLIVFVRKNMPGYRLEITRIGWPPLAAQTGSDSHGSKVSAAFRNPHTMRPSLAFDFRLVRLGSTVSTTGSEYAKIGAEAIRLGAAWGPNVRGGVLGEGGNLRNHIEVANAQEAVAAQLKKVAAGLAPAGAVDAYLAGIGSAPAGDVTTRGAPCPGSVS
jgi:murein DD-endopeptidase MepM/ murein hydrolase activator NlpD